MADDKTTTTDEQAPADKAADTTWQPDFKEEDLTVPYKREEESNEDDDQKTNGAKDSDESSEEAGEDDIEERTEPAPAITAQDPGEYQPADYSFEIEIDGKTHKVDSPEKAEQLGEEYADKLTAKQLFALISKGSKIDIKQERDKEKWEAAKKTFDEQTNTENQRQEVVNTIANEMNYLVGKGRLPKVTAELQNADWANPKVATQPGVKEQLALLDYMMKENAIRAKAGIKPFGPVDALIAMQNDEGEKAKMATNRVAGEARKLASSRVAGVAPTQSEPYVPKGIAVGRTGVFNRGAAMWDD